MNGACPLTVQGEWDPYVCPLTWVSNLSIAQMV